MFDILHNQQQHENDSPKVLCESEHYFVVLNEKEIWLNFKNENRKSICIGNYCGDALSVFIDRDERFIAISGFGLIIYFTEEPFQDYKPDLKTTQWIEYGRSVDRKLRFEDIIQIDCQTIQVSDCSRKLHRFTVDLNIHKESKEHCFFLCSAADCPSDGVRMLGHYCGFGYDVSCCYSDDSAATSYFSPLYTDSTEYHVIYDQKDAIKPEGYRILSKLCRCNYLEVKKLINSQFNIFSGQAKDVLKVTEQLADSGIQFIIKPDFPYSKNDLWQE